MAQTRFLCPLLVAVLCFVLTFAAEKDAKFLQCCKNKGLSEKCQAYCNYEGNGQKSAAYFNRIFTNRRRSPCPLEKLGDYVGCMAAGKDNRQCCEERGLKQFAPDCLQFCNGANTTSLKLNNCLLISARFDIAGCHKENA